ncbi:MAG: hypothetical protein IPP17_11540 [Bacteroidetes bacterium]|nr:hypothetical protein [Bacteroidota bacterium]
MKFVAHGTQKVTSFEIHFFGSAFGLAIYHAFIVGMSVWLGFKDPEELAPDPKTVAE